MDCSNKGITTPQRECFGTCTTSCTQHLEEKLLSLIKSEERKVATK
jgi:hypothetical protein